MAREEQKQRSALIRQEILDTALDIGIKEGFEAISIRKIVNEMKYSIGIIYHHFKDKQEIIDAIEQNETQWLQSKIAALLKNDQDFLTELQLIFHMIMILAFEEPEKYNLIVLRKYSRKNPGQPRWISEIETKLKHAMDAGNIRKMDGAKAAFSIWSSFLGFNLMISRHENLTRKQAEEMFSVQFDIISKGVFSNE